MFIAMSDVTHILSQIEQGDSQAAEKLLPLVYDELRKLAAAKLAKEKPGQTFQATALVHEAYLRLVGSGRSEVGGQRSDSYDPTSDIRHPTSDLWHSRGHFFAAAAEAMRRILINRARDKQRLKRSGQRLRINLEGIEVAFNTPDEDLLALDEALEMLAAEDPLCGQLVKLRFFAGLSQGEAAQSLGIPRRTADRHWAYARAWLARRLQADETPESDAVKNPS